MKYGNYIVRLARPYESQMFGFYSVSYEPWYGVFMMKPYNKGIGITDDVEGSYKVDLVPCRSSVDLFPERSYYVCDLKSSHYKEFDCVNEAAKADGFCKVQNQRLLMMREIMKNPDKHIYFVDTKGDVHQFFYNPEKNSFYEIANGEKAVVLYVSEWEMQKILFNIDWEYTNPMKTKYNSFWKRITHLFTKH